MPATALYIIIFAIAIGYATFVEDIYGTIASKALIYNSKWFEAIILLISISIIVNIFRFKLYLFSKLPIFLFHLSFLLIIAGAACTRYLGVDGLMSIRENNSSSYVTSSDFFFRLRAEKDAKSEHFYKKTLLSPISVGNLNTTIDFEGNDFHFKSTGFYPGAQSYLQASENGEAIMHLLVSINGHRENIYIKDGNAVEVYDYVISFNTMPESDFYIEKENGQLFFSSRKSGKKMSMANNEKTSFAANEKYSFEKSLLYTIDDANILMIDYMPNAMIAFDPYSKQGNIDIVKVRYESNNKKEDFYLPIGRGVNQSVIFSDKGTKLRLSFGSRIYKLPFSIKLNDFILERYPGSNSPSSFISNVTVTDNNKTNGFDYSIYMNHILKHQGWRFFQSSYDPDEQGTVLSASYDVIGVTLTYAGYFLMIAAMLLSLFIKKSRFKSYLKKLAGFQKKSIAGIILFITISISSFAQNAELVIPDNTQADKFGSILYQEKNGRIRPINTLSLELIRKMRGSSSYKSLSANSIVLGIMMDGEKWANEKIIKVANEELRKKIGISDKYACFNDFIDTNKKTSYKLYDWLNVASRKLPGERNKFDKEVIAVDERLNVYSMIQYQMLFTVFPSPLDINASWFSPADEIKDIPSMDSLFFKTGISMYIGYLQNNDTANANMILNGISNYQKQYASSILPSKTRQRLEQINEKINIFSKLSLIYFILGLIALVLVFIKVFRASNKAVALNIIKILLYIGLVLQGSGIAIRWYISGHAPFSNGYEAMLFISFVGLLTGLILSKKSVLLLPITTLFASAPLLVAHLSLMNPEITNLVPVLKSYWLSIHVATITASYGVLGCVTFAALMNLVLMMFKNKRNKAKIDLMTEELTSLNKLALIIGLYLLTIGSFLGGIWANESWGTYWSWDPKETWSLVAILIYAFVAHINHIPDLKGKFSFNLFAFWAYSTILMTYFGVNYYLGGLHSYASGESKPIPTAAIVSVAVLIIISVIAGIKENRNNKMIETSN